MSTNNGQRQPSPNEHLRREVASLLNSLSRDNHTGTPDFILAGVMVDALIAYEATTIRRDDWWSFEPKIGGTIPARDLDLHKAAATSAGDPW